MGTTQTPADLAGLLALAVGSAVIARRVEIEPRPGWREPVNLYVSVLLDPANRKSAVFTTSYLVTRWHPSESRTRRRIGESNGGCFSPTNGAGSNQSP